MKTIPALLSTHYGAGTTTLADLLKITRKDGQVFAFTSASTDVTISAQLYTSAQGLDISSMEITAGLAVDNLELTTLDDGTIFSRLEVLAGVWRNADFVISRYNWASPSDGVEVRMVGTIGEVHLNRGSVTAELRGLQQYLQQPIGSVTSKTCRARLGDSRCLVNLTGHTHAGSVSSAASNQVFAGSFGTHIPGDEFYTSVSLLLHGDGTNGSTTFTDNSPTPKTVTPSGNAQISTTQSKFGGASMAFDGTGDYLTIPSSSAFDFGSADFTIEAWVYTTSAAAGENRIIIDRRGNPSTADISLVFYYNPTTGFLELGTSTNGTTTTTFIGSLNVPMNQWVHVAAARSGTQVWLCVNGTAELIGLAISGALFASTSLVAVGGRLDGLRSWNGYIDDLRITKGVARYTANFTPPASAFLNNEPSGGGGATAGWYNGGLVTFTSGLNNGLTQKVKDYDGSGNFTLSLPMLQTIQAGDTFTAITGCQKRLEDCSTKFSNVLNFQGEPHLPGIDAVTS